MMMEDVISQESDVDSSLHDGGVNVSPNDTTIGSFSVLPQDCLDGILSSLSLRECLTIGMTSLTFMGVIQSDLQRRRNKMTQSFAYTCLPGLQYKLVPWNDHTKDDTPLPTERLPTVCDRVESLCGALSRSDPSSAMARELLEEINRQHEIGHSDTFEDALVIHINLIRSHRLYSDLIVRTIYAHPLTDPNQKSTLSVTLERFMSDVLCAFYLMGPVVAGIVEGCPTEKAWLDSSLSVDVRANGPSNNGNTTYQAWIYLYSTLIRLAPLSLERLLCLGSLTTDSIGDSDQFHLPFCGQEFRNRFRQVKENLFHRAPICVTVHEFGILGPTFRGRDRIQSKAFSPLTLSFCMFQLATRDSMTSYYARAIRFLLYMNEEAKKVRPLTVSPPVVIFDCTPQHMDRE